MSVRVLTIVWDASPSHGSALLVELALADQAGDDGVTWVEIPRLARKTRLSDRQVIRAVADLVAAGRIERRKAQRGRKRVSVYRVLGPGLRAVDYERMPFTLDSPFSSRYDKLSHDKLSGRQARRHDTRGTDDMTPEVAPRARSLATSTVREPVDPAAGAARARSRDPVWDALDEVCGPATTKRARSLRGQVAKSLKEAGATGEEVKLRAARYPLVMPPETILTDAALEKHWDRCVPKRTRSGGKTCPDCGVSVGAGHASDCPKASADVA